MKIAELLLYLALFSYVLQLVVHSLLRPRRHIEPLNFSVSPDDH